jgi:glutathione S-transferase
MGEGRYAERLSYKDWFEFGVNQRIHHHFLESMTSIVTWILIAGVRFPIQAISFGAGYSLARLLFHIGYHMKGPSARFPGFLL